MGMYLYVFHDLSFWFVNAGPIDDKWTLFLLYLVYFFYVTQN